jgi:hypothetical protein
MIARSTLVLSLFALAVAGCGHSDGATSAPPAAAPAQDCSNGDTALSTCLNPRQSADYYVQQSLKYFDTLDVKADPASVPVYSDLVARWEWPPWLKLTGYGRDVMISSDELVRKNTPSTVPTRDCRAFSTQPFARCRIVFQYDGGPCPIYEEFTFNDQGEMTFIEAWTDAPDKLPAPASDPWGEGSGVHRLSTKVPGLGSATGRIDPSGAAMAAAAAKDADVADFVPRAQDFWGTWFQELKISGKDIYARGCGWLAVAPPGTR